jgi:cytoskeletal protein CcmA (bactofilin family)
MGIFGNSKEEQRAAEDVGSSSNIIGKGTVIEGNITTTGNIRIEGRLVGNVISKAKVVLGQSAEVEGNITAQNAEIAGSVRGKTDVTELLTLKGTSVLTGDITTAKLVVEAGATFNGRCVMGQTKTAGKSAE